MWLVLCSSSDPSGLWAYQGLKNLGVAPIELVLTEWLAYGAHWEHRLDSAGTHTKIVLPDGRTISSARIRGAVNRLIAPSPGLAQRASGSDREYAQTEIQAFYLSWLNGLPGVVVNRPTATGLCGAWFHPSEWAVRAARAGLPALPYRQSSHDAPDSCYQPHSISGTAMLNLIAFRGEVFGGRVPDRIARGCTKLCEEAGAELLGIQLAAGADSEWRFAGANPCPELSPGGTPLLQSLAQALTEGGRP